ncbi:Gtpase activating protein [Coemansia sp. RSA 2711]|nr:Gtpase activating protein [Coemansia sp. RSA 2711]
MVTATDKEKKRLAEKHHKLLAELSKRPENASCARWAAWNLGVFLCIRCGGLHRHIGTHVSKVKSISLDNWTTEQIEHFRHIGNARANAFFNPHPDRHPAPRADRDVERFIRDKYQHRLFVDRHSSVPDPSVIGAAPSSPAASGSEAPGLTRLHEMGFTDVRANHAALQKFGMDVDRAARYLRGEDDDLPQDSISVKDPRVVQLLNMGFSSAVQNARALTQCQGDVNRAIELLLSSNPPSRSAPTSPPPPPPAKATPAVPPKSPAADLLDGDLFASTSTQQPAALDDLLGGLSLSESKPASQSTAPAAQESNDLFGDFGDFLSAGPELPQTAPAAPAAPAAAAAPVKPASPPSHGGQSMLDTSFIMSLYSKPSSTSNASNPKPAASGNTNSGFNDLDFFM